MDGIELARHVGRLPRVPAVIFTTAYDEYAVRAFELAAVDYSNRCAQYALKCRSHCKGPPHASPPADEILRQMAPANRSHFSINERSHFARCRWRMCFI